jgi:hypothetical protein
MEGKTNKSTLRVASYNCNSIRKKIDIIRQLLSSCDILLCQEIILLPEDVSFIDNIDSEFDSFAVPSNHANSNSFDGRPYGGCALFWRKKRNIDVEICSFGDYFIIASVVHYNYAFCLANIYMPCDKRTAESICHYQRILGELQAALDAVDMNNLLCVGDYNADPNRGRLWPHLYDFVEHNRLVVPDLALPLHTFTYLSPAHNTTSWLDHIVSSEAVKITDISVGYDIALFDHFPLYFNIVIDTVQDMGTDDCCVRQDTDLLRQFIDWPNFNNDAERSYNNSIECKLNYMNVCDTLHCESDHRELIDANYKYIIDTLKEGTKDYTIIKAKKFVPVPGWNRYCKDLYREARGSFLQWLQAGKVRIGPKYNSMKYDRNLFNDAFKYCKRNEQSIRDSMLGEHLRSKNMCSFWKEVGRRRVNKNDTSSEIDGVKSPVCSALNLAQYLVVVMLTLLIMFLMLPLDNG